MSTSLTRRFAIATSTSLLLSSAPMRAAGPAVEVAVEQRANAYASLAADESLVVLAWGASTDRGVTDVFAAVSRDGGRAFGPPVRVNRAAGDASLSGEQPPRAAIVSKPGQARSIVVVWTAQAPGGTRLLSSRSSDGGRTFAMPAPLEGSEAPGNRGWESIAADGAGSVVAIWLDHRETATADHAAMNHTGHQAGSESDGVTRAQLSKLYFARLESPSRAQAVTGGVCYCCKTTIAAGADGMVYAAWRHVFPGNIRDIAFTQSADGGRTFAAPVRVSDDRWVLDGCPENGPSMAVDDRHRVHVVWPTLVPGATSSDAPTLALYYATSRDGRTFTPRQPIPTEGVPRHPQIALGRAGELIVVWDEQAAGTRRIAMARGTLDDRGAARFVRQAFDDPSSAQYPAVVRVGEGALAAWTSGPAGHTRIRVVPLAR